MIILILLNCILCLYGASTYKPLNIMGIYESRVKYIMNATERYNSLNPNNKFNVSTRSDDGYLDWGDIIAIDTFWVYDRTPFYSNLSDSFSKRELRQHFDAIVSANSPNGYLQAAPWFFDTGILLYRKDLVREYFGDTYPPVTYSEMAEMAKVIQEGERKKGNNNFWGFIFEPDIDNAGLEFSAAYGCGTFLDTNNKVTIGPTEACLKAWNTVRSWLGDITPANIADGFDDSLWFSGNAAFFRIWVGDYLTSTTESELLRGKFDATSIPGSGLPGTNYATLGGWELAVNLRSPRQQDAKDFIHFLVSEEEQIRRTIITAGGLLPTIQSSYSDPRLCSLPNTAYLCKIQFNLVVRPRLIGSRDWRKVCSPWGKELLRNKSLSTYDGLTLWRKNLKEFMNDTDPVVNPQTVIKTTENSFSTGWIIAVAILCILLLIGMTITAFYCIRKANTRTRVIKLVPKGGKMSLMFTDIQNSSLLWSLHSEDMRIALHQHNRLMRQAIEKYRGYEVKTIGDSFMVSFHNSKDAVSCSNMIQMTLLQAEWPPGLLFNENCKQVTDSRYGTIWSGLRVRIGINCGHADMEYDGRTNKVDYYGQNVNLAARIESIAYGGQVLISQDVYTELDEENNEAVYIGEFTFKGVAGPRKVYQINTVTGRQFPPNQGQQVSEIAAMDRGICTKCMRPCNHCARERNARSLGWRKGTRSTATSTTFSGNV